jgi:hypothetical protein
MKIHRPSFLLALAFAVYIPATSAHAQPTVAPGGTIVFTAADGGSVTCRRLAPIGCIPGIVNGTTDASARSLTARSLIPVTGAGVPNYATATIYNDFTIAGAGVDTVVDAQVDVMYDFFSSINVAVLSKVAADLSLSIVDIGFGFPIPVAASAIVSTNRTSENGVTDVSQGTENNNLSGANAHFQAKLRRGHTYRLQFTLETLGEVTALGVARVVSDAAWRRLAVTIDEDEVEQLGMHDSDMKGLLAAHDRDVKELLAQVIRLLNTPTGRRPEFPIK